MVALRGDFRPLRQHRAIPALWLKTLESLDTLDAIISPENIRRNLQSENDIYKFEYRICSANGGLPPMVKRNRFYAAQTMAA